ncbi:Pseudouridine synthase I, TruA, alpha/beta domain [Dillenia turbinata]|uniref:Pseudouridine synthase I, TruA, alpha/beta domain n=1 Tax=Dillenia turbinata TaxID=194707 RepID=A0AAN8ZJF4_9MAGN
MSELEDQEIILNLRHQIESLQNRVRELKLENEKLSLLVSNCKCCKIKENAVGTCVTSVDSAQGCRQPYASSDTGEASVVARKKSAKRLQGHNTKTLCHLPKRYVALKVMYFGQRFYGFASEAQMDPTVESEIFGALEKTRLLVGDKKEIKYSRCGRTDRGVSSVGQVIALFLRSNLKGNGENGISNNNSKGHNYGEIDYVRVLNRVLPKDIRVMGWTPAPSDFSARSNSPQIPVLLYLWAFSCLSREYKYFFWRENLDILTMEEAGKKFIGEHDFRNFCKMDAANVHNYRRHITSFEMSPCNQRFESNQLWAITIKGSAFLWHQVRCMVAVLFMIGQGLESPNVRICWEKQLTGVKIMQVIDALLSTNITHRKPQYAMAPDIPLVLLSCEFEGLNFSCSPEAMQALRLHLEEECRTLLLHAAIFYEALISSSSIAAGTKYQTTLSNGRVKKKASHVPLMLRPTEPSYEERCAKLSSRA